MALAAFWQDVIQDISYVVLYGSHCMIKDESIYAITARYGHQFTTEKVEDIIATTPCFRCALTFAFQGVDQPVEWPNYSKIIMVRLYKHGVSRRKLATISEEISRDISWLKCRCHDPARFIYSVHSLWS